MDLGDKAGRQGGEVRALLGNHETMIMMGDLRYVSKEEYRAFAGPDSEKIRETEYENYVKFRQQRAKRLRQPSPSLGESEKQAWMGSHKPGFFEFRQAFAPNGKYGTWLRTHDAVTQVGDGVFLHGGLSPQLPQKNIKEINEKIRREIVQMDEIWAKLAKKGVIWPYMNQEEARAEAKIDWNLLQQGGGGDPELQSLLQTFLNIGHLTMVSPEGPLWYRGYAQDSESELSSKLDQVLKRFKVHYMVIGHTVTPTKRIMPRFDGRVFMIDTGMLAAYFQGRPSALEINGGHFKAIYAGEEPQDLSASGASKTH